MSIEQPCKKYVRADTDGFCACGFHKDSHREARHQEEVERLQAENRRLREETARLQQAESEWNDRLVAAGYSILRLKAKIAEGRAPDCHAPFTCGPVFTCSRCLSWRAEVKG